MLAQRAAVCLVPRNSPILTYIFDLLKIMHLLLWSWGTFRKMLGFLPFFASELEAVKFSCRDEGIQGLAKYVYRSSVIFRLHDQANIEQSSSKHLAKASRIHVHDVFSNCSMFA